MRTAWMKLCLRGLAFLALAAASLPGANAEPGAAHRAPAVDTLDGRRFMGEFVPIGKSSGRPDDFVFADGKFHSRECLKIGFAPGPYWVRAENGRLHFLVRLTSEENGVMTYEGSVAGGEIDVRIEWVKPRWYWTMKRNFRFRGTSAADPGRGN